MNVVTSDQVVDLFKKGCSLKRISSELKISHSKVKKILITQNIYPNNLSRQIAIMQLDGLSRGLITKRLKISDKVYNANTRYTKGMYASQTPTLAALRTRATREKKKKS